MICGYVDAVQLSLNTIFQVELENDYIIGCVIGGYLFPLVADGADLHGAPEMVKIRINGIVNKLVFRTLFYRGEVIH